MKIEFTVYGEPKPKGRHRSFVRGGKVLTYADPKTKQAEADFLTVALQHRPQKPLEGPIVLTCRFYRGIPKSFSRKKRELAMERKLFPTTRPDVDNLVKLVKDALNGVFWRDDAQVVLTVMGKFYSDVPRTEVTIETIGQS